MAPDAEAFDELEPGHDDIEFFTNTSDLYRSSPGKRIQKLHEINGKIRNLGETCSPYLRIEKCD